MSVAETIRERLAALEPQALDLVDEAKCTAATPATAKAAARHWRLSIVSARFAGQSTLERHRMIYRALGSLMQHPIHALAITARSPEETKGKQ